MVNLSISVRSELYYTLCCVATNCLWITSYIWVLSKAAEETQTMKRPLDTSQPVGVLGWEVLEAEGPITENQTESSVSAKEEETSGLVKAIVGVFHKG